MTPAELKLAFENRIQVKEVDPLSEYKGKWACLWIWPNGTSIGPNRYDTAEEVRALVLLSTQQTITLDEAKERDVVYTHLRVPFRSVIGWMPWPVKP